MSERVAIIRNRFAGQGKSSLVDRIAEKLRRGGQHVRMLNTEFAGHATELATKIAATGEADVIVAAGGDGTIREVAEGAYGHKVPVGIIPAGSANVLARELGYMKSGQVSARHVANALLSRDIVDLYPFEVERDGRVQLGLCWVGVGFDAEVLRNVSPSLKEKIGRTSFVPAILQALVGDSSLPDITWHMHKNTKGTCGWALLSNIRRYAGPFIVTKKTTYNSHGLACLMSQEHGAWPRIMDQLAIGMRRFDKRAGVWLLEKATLHLGSDQTPVQMDGDFLGFGMVEVTPKKHPLPFRAFVRR
ncbi:diacylglycerol/lipid kinase family protein [Kordiimonas lacus]|uniref:Diacylglycerol kinase family enzyme n=1 Tax=Kordiimonas lacus TaxID=637679 RepID=A0A1G6ULH8_9PROT|nr:diacylglycerol kinase family protein [Kordiimonas lacus]SDD41437.1 Diacylglycerol kinase family enzyme [Kordiimonas lacus]